jgi:hypothetical protein
VEGRWLAEGEVCKTADFMRALRRFEVAQILSWRDVVEALPHVYFG